MSPGSDLTPHAPRVGAMRATFADTRGELRTDTGDQTGRDGSRSVAWTWTKDGSTRGGVDFDSMKPENVAVLLTIL
jgi:hypothetical protein